nr:histidine kinase dimerization/phosphoacceptor domain-containing protein [Micromonospora sp. DSM 115978]
VVEVLDDPAYYATDFPQWMTAMDPWVGAAACLALWWRRRFPLGLAIGTVPVLAFSDAGFGAVLVALLTVAVHRPLPQATLVTLPYVALSGWFGYYHPPTGLNRWLFVAIIVLMYLVPLCCGSAVRSRRHLSANLRREATRERREHRLRLAGARRAERESIAREMHDVLAHRISLISVHAGALSYRTAQAEAGSGPPLSAADVNQAIKVIDDSSRQALVELGDVLAVLRAGRDPDHEEDWDEQDR